MNTKLVKAYRAERKHYWTARQALSAARTRLAWDDLDGYDASDGWDLNSYTPGEAFGPVRLRLEPEQEFYDDSYIDTWTDETQAYRDKVRKELWECIERDGVWGLIGEFWNGQEWEHADSCWGFVGDDWQNSGYDIDIMQATIDAYHEHMTAAARAMEAERPDMYMAR